MKQYDPVAKRWRPLKYRSRRFTDTESRYSPAKVVEWCILSSQIYLYVLGEVFEVDTYRKPLLPLLSGNRTTAALRIESLKEAIARGYFTTQERHLHKGGSRRRDDRPRNTNSSSQVPAPECG